MKDCIIHSVRHDCVFTKRIEIAEARDREEEAKAGCGWRKGGIQCVLPRLHVGAHEYKAAESECGNHRYGPCPDCDPAPDRPLGCADCGMAVGCSCSQAIAKCDIEQKKPYDGYPEGKSKFVCYTHGVTFFVKAEFPITQCRP